VLVKRSAEKEEQEKLKMKRGKNHLLHTKVSIVMSMS
jgi:hypothetical protein